MPVIVPGAGSTPINTGVVTSAILQNAAIGDGNGTDYDITGMATVQLLVNPTAYTGTVTFWSSIDGTTFLKIKGNQQDTTTIADNVANPGSTASIWTFQTAGLTKIRAVMSSSGGTSCTVTGAASPFPNSVPLGVTLSSAVLAAGTAVIGHVINDASTASIGAVALIDGLKATYSAAKVGLVPASSATDIFTLTGSATKTVRVTRIEMAGTSTAATAAALDVLLLKRSTADTGGTSTGSPTAVPHDSANAAASATVLAYTANPTTGNLVGTALRNQKLMLALATDTATDFPPMDRIVWDFGNRPSQAIVLRGIADVLAINLNAATATATASVDIAIEWSEE